LATLEAADLIFAVAIPRGGDGRGQTREEKEKRVFFHDRLCAFNSEKNISHLQLSSGATLTSLSSLSRVDLRRFSPNSTTLNVTSSLVEV
jgi:hypothetical protein